MDKKLFGRLKESMAQMNEIAEGSRQPARETNVIALQVKAIRTASGLSQSGFARLISVSVDTLRTGSRAVENLPGRPKPCCVLLNAIRSTLFRRFR